MLPPEGPALEEVEFGFEFESLDWVFEESELDEKRASMEVIELGVRAGFGAGELGIELVSRLMLAMSLPVSFLEGFAIRNIDFQLGVDGVVGVTAKSPTDAAAAGIVLRMGYCNHDGGRRED